MDNDSLTLAWALLPKACLETLYMTFFSGLFATLLGLPMGIVLMLTRRGHLLACPPFYRTLEAIVNVGRSFPFAILMVALIPITRWIVSTSLGTTAAIVPLTIAAAPFVARLVETSLSKVDRHMVEASMVMGSTVPQMVLKVFLPEALPALVADITLTLVNLVGYSAMAGLIGGGGLGQVAIQYGYHRFNTPIMVLTVILLVIIVQGLQWIGHRLATSILVKRGLRHG